MIGKHPQKKAFQKQHLSVPHPFFSHLSMADWHRCLASRRCGIAMGDSTQIDFFGCSNVIMIMVFHVFSCDIPPWFIHFAMGKTLGKTGDRKLVGG
jgi:hypothetical protein